MFSSNILNLRNIVGSVKTSPNVAVAALFAAPPPTLVMLSPPCQSIKKSQIMSLSTNPLLLHVDRYRTDNARSNTPPMRRTTTKTTPTTTRITKSNDKKTVSKSLPRTVVMRDGIGKDTTTPLVDYVRGWAWQQTILNRRLDYHRRKKQSHPGNGVVVEADGGSVPENSSSSSSNGVVDEDCLLLLQHHPVYTLGRGADEGNILFLEGVDDGDERRRRLARSARGSGSARLSVSQHETDVDCVVDRLFDEIKAVHAPNGAPIYRVDRGGEVTFHGPGQLVCYPLLDLRRDPFKKDLHWYLRAVEEVIIRTLRVYGIEGTRDHENTGVWVGDEKIAAVGVSSARWITTHGFAINVNPDLAYFDTSVIIPCGIEGKSVTSIFEVMTERGDGASCPDLNHVAEETVKSFESVFGVETVTGHALR